MFHNGSTNLERKFVMFIFLRDLTGSIDMIDTLIATLCSLMYVFCFILFMFLLLSLLSHLPFGVKTDIHERS